MCYVRLHVVGCGWLRTHSRTPTRQDFTTTANRIINTPAGCATGTCGTSMRLCCVFLGTCWGQSELGLGCPWICVDSRRHHRDPLPQIRRCLLTHGTGWTLVGFQTRNKDGSPPGQCPVHKRAFMDMLHTCVLLSASPHSFFPCS